MKNLILITILILTFITGDSYSQSYFGKSLFKDRIQANNVLYVTSLAQGTNEHATIASALSAYQPGMVIILAPEYFDEDVTISIDNVHIQGLNKELSKIKSLTVTGSKAIINNLTIENDFTFTSQSAWSWYNDGAFFNSVIFKGNAYFGTPITKVMETYALIDCDFTQDNKDIVINAYVGNVHWYNTRIQGAGKDIKIYEGDVRLLYDRGIYIDSLCYMDGNKLAHVGFYELSSANIGNLKTVIGTQFQMLIINGCNLVFGSAFTMNGKFELDVILSSITMQYDIVFNSTANSRFLSFFQKKYQSTATISGTGLANLYIYNSVFRCSAPNGLGANAGNVWNAFIDD